MAMAMVKRRRQLGTSLIEVLITMVLGLGGMQSRLQISDLESYQRSQALLLLDDMASRISINRAAANTYVTGAAAPLGVGMNCPATDASSSLVDLDKAQWCSALQGAAELVGGSNAGAMIGARGCIEQLPNDSYLITIAWQGMVPIASPPTSVACGQDEYDSGTTCTGDMCRRVVTTVLRIASLN
jgi:type IV pilus assembly protein PilV